MARITSEKAVEMVGNRFDMILLAAARQRQLIRGDAPKIKSNDSTQLIALQEIEQGLIGIDYSRRSKR